MSTYKKPGSEHCSTPPPEDGSIPRAFGETAQQIWLAGLGALGRAQEEGGRLFDTLVREGREVDRGTRSHADGLREGIEATADMAREQASAGWVRLEQALGGGLQRTLTRLGVPTRSEVAELNARIEALTAELRARDAAERREKARAKTDPATPRKRAPRRRGGASAAAETGSPARATSAVAPGRASAAAGAITTPPPGTTGAGSTEGDI